MPINDLQRLLPRHHAIIDLSVAGLKHIEIASQLGITPQSVGQVVGSPLAQHEIARRRKVQETTVDTALGSTVSEARSLLERNAKMAAETLVTLAETSIDDAVRRNSANDILDRTFGKDGKAQVNVTVLSAERLQLLQIALTESEAV